jgi:hypothetical protein
MTLSAQPDERVEALEALIQAASEFMTAADYTVEVAIEDELLAALDQAHGVLA